MADRKYVAIGDIHGCVESLQALIKKLEPWNDRTFVFIGDYIDRGPASRQVVDYLIEFQENHDCIVLRGNHEQMLLDAFNTNDTKLWLHNGGDATLQSYGNVLTEISFEHYQFYNETQIHFDTREYFFVHAGLPTKTTIRDFLKKGESQQAFLWERSHLKTDENDWEKTVVFGHTPAPDPVVKRNMIGIDTGCVYNQIPGMGNLTAVLLPEKKFINQPCLDLVE
ncbi:MAG: metallophosphoesterase family protein [Balneolales bacterium]